MTEEKLTKKRVEELIPFINGMNRTQLHQIKGFINMRIRTKKKLIKTEFGWENVKPL